MEPTQQQLIARWNSARDVWEENTGAPLYEHWDVFSETWPLSGSMRSGEAFALPTSAPPMADSACSSLLPTPSAALATNGGSQAPAKRRAGGHSVQLHDVLEHL